MKAFTREGSHIDMNDLDKIINSVRRPSRYTGGEWNSYSTPATSRLRPKAAGEPSASICLCYPDLYEIGTSSMGLEILYAVVNGDTRFSADRCFAPADDLAAALRSRGETLFSLETKKPLKDFDAIGFTLQHELCASNILYMLDAAGVSAFSKDRAETFPLILGGGPLTMNPEPLADFFDAFVIGDGEDAVVEIMERLAAAKTSGAGKRELLESLAGVPGVYVPSLYEPVYDERKVYSGLRKLSHAAPDKVAKRVFDIASRPPVAAPVVPSAASVHSRLSVEIARGCPHSCSFCQASGYYKPLRVRRPDVILEAVRVGLKNTGYDEVSFASLSSGDYPGIARLIEGALSANTLYPVSVALPSLHCDNFGADVAGALAKSASRPSVTLAPEAGTEGLRERIGKRLSDDAVVAAVSAAHTAGWKQVKLYFMYGLPTETDADIEGIAALVKRIRSECRGIGIKVSMSPFVPKPGTKFEREPFAGTEELSRKKTILRKLLGGAVKSHDGAASFTEALLSRGDRRLSGVIAAAYAMGARFDQWSEFFRFDIWMKAFEDAGIDVRDYVNRFGTDFALPWSHISISVAAPSARGEAGSEVPVEPSPAVLAAAAPQREIKSVRFRIRLARKSSARFISHNDQVEVFRRAVRIARLPVKYSAGFHPQPKIAFGPAIAVGYESEAEYMEVEFLRYVPPQETSDRLNECLPEGYAVLSVRQIPTAFASLESLCGVEDYSVFFDVPPVDAPGALQKFLALESSVVEVDSKPRDLKKIIRSASFENGVLSLAVNLLPSGNLKPDKITAHIFGVAPESLLVRRLRFYAVKRDGAIIEI